MITLACLECRLALRTSSEKHDEVNFLIGMYSEWYPDRYPCPRSECKGKMTLTDAIAADELEYLEMHDVTPQEAFQALQGMGLPSEKACTVEGVRAAFAQRVIELDVAPVPGTQRVLLRSLKVEDGTRLFVASSPFGAVVYRIAPPRSVTREVLSENL
jgi:hypothetical protein